MIVKTEELNSVQTAAVEHTDGPCLIFAGAGSGRPAVLTHRIAYLLNKKKVFPDRILAVTFTNKAAGEMKSRLEAMVGARRATLDRHVSRDVRAYAAPRRQEDRHCEQFRHHGRHRSASDHPRHPHDLYMDERQVTPGTLSLRSARRRKLLARSQRREASVIPRRALCRRLPRDERRLRESNGLDFDDLISRTIELLETDEETRARYQSKFRYILVDEYQDVNYAQYKLCAILADEHRISRSSATTTSRSTPRAAATTR